MFHISQIQFSYNRFNSQHSSPHRILLRTYQKPVVKHGYNSVGYEVLSVVANVPILSVHDVVDCDVRQAENEEKKSSCVRSHR